MLTCEVPKVPKVVANNHQEIQNPQSKIQNPKLKLLHHPIPLPLILIAAAYNLFPLAAVR